MLINIQNAITTLNSRSTVDCHQCQKLTLKNEFLETRSLNTALRLKEEQVLYKQAIAELIIN
jgi:hypothetical protein